MKAVVIGGGFTGLTAALRLVESGRCDVTLVEAADGLGGLAGGFKLAGCSIEKTYHHLFNSDTDIIALVHELGMDDRLEWHNSSVGIFIRGKIWPFNGPFDLLRFSPCPFFSRLRLALALRRLQKTRDWQSLAKISAWDWMRNHCGDGAMNTVWSPLLKGKFERHAEEVSMAWLWARIHIRANSRAHPFAREQLGYFNGGFDCVIQELRRRLQARGAKILLGKPVQKITASPDKIQLEFSGGEMLQGDVCLFTGPSGSLARIVDSSPPEVAAWKRRLESIDYLGAVCMVFTSSQNLGDQYWLNINDPASPFLVFLNHTSLVDPARYSGQFVYYIGKYTAHESETFNSSDDKLTRSWFDFARIIFPDFDESKIIEKHIFRLRNAQHVVDTNYESKLPPYATPVPRLLLANFSQVFPEDRGTNYAVREGNKIAAMILGGAEK